MAFGARRANISPPLPLWPSLRERPAPAPPRYGHSSRRAETWPYDRYDLERSRGVIFERCVNFDAESKFCCRGLLNRRFGKSTGPVFVGTWGLSATITPRRGGAACEVGRCFQAVLHQEQTVFASVSPAVRMASLILQGFACWDSRVGPRIDFFEDVLFFTSPTLRHQGVLPGAVDGLLKKIPVRHNAKCCRLNAPDRICALQGLLSGGPSSYLLVAVSVAGGMQVCCVEFDLGGARTK